MRRARFFSIITLVVGALYGAVGFFFFLPQASYEGDLTRIGKLPESLFGWFKPQPGIAPELLQQTSWQDADVLVIGDSFSKQRLWQTVLTAHGLKVRTEPWFFTKRVDICEGFYPWLRAQGFKGKYIVIETVERNLKENFTRSSNCKKMPSYFDIGDSPSSPPRAFNRDKKDHSGQISAGILTWINQIKYKHLSALPDFSGMDLNDVRLERVTGGCRLFSHLSCRDVLFFGTDNGKKDWGSEEVKLMKTLNARLGNLSSLWVVVPDKSTAYLYPEKKFWEIAGEQLHSVNLLKPVRQAIAAGVVDLYPANNTHFSTTGYLLMGQEIYKNLLSDGLDRK